MKPGVESSRFCSRTCWASLLLTRQGLPGDVPSSQLLLGDSDISKAAPPSQAFSTFVCGGSLRNAANSTSPVLLRGGCGLGISACSEYRVHLTELSFLEPPLATASNCVFGAPPSGVRGPQHFFSNLVERKGPGVSPFLPGHSREAWVT